MDRSPAGAQPAFFPFPPWIWAVLVSTALMSWAGGISAGIRAASDEAGAASAAASLERARLEQRVDVWRQRATYLRGLLQDSAAVCRGTRADTTWRDHDL